MAAPVSHLLDITQASAAVEAISQSKITGPTRFLGNHFTICDSKEPHLDLSSIVVPCLMHLQFSETLYVEKRKTASFITSLSQIFNADYPEFAHLIPVLIHYPIYQLSSRVDRLAWLVFCSELLCFERKNLSLFTMHAQYGLRNLKILESKPSGVSIKSAKSGQTYGFTLPDVITPLFAAFLFDIFQRSEEPKSQTIRLKRSDWNQKLKKIHPYCFHDDLNISSFARNVYWAHIYDNSRNEIFFYFQEFLKESDSVARFLPILDDLKAKNALKNICPELYKFLPILQSQIRTFDASTPYIESDFLPYIGVFEDYQRTEEKKFRDFSLLLKIQLEIKKNSLSLDRTFSKVLLETLSEQLLKSVTPTLSLPDFSRLSVYKPFYLPIEPTLSTLFEEEDDLVAHSPVKEHDERTSPPKKPQTFVDYPITPPRETSSTDTFLSDSPACSGASCSPMSYASAAARSPGLPNKKAITHAIFDFTLNQLRTHLEANRIRSRFFFQDLPKFNLSHISLSERVKGWYLDKEKAFKIQGYTHTPKWKDSTREERIKFQDHMEFIHTFPEEADLLHLTTYCSFMVHEEAGRPSIKEWIFALPCMVSRKERTISGVILPASEHCGWLVSVINPETLECKHRCFDEATDDRPFASSIMYGWHSMIASWDWERVTESRLVESTVCAVIPESKAPDEITYRLDSSTNILTIQSGNNIHQFFKIR